MATSQSGDDLIAPIYDAIIDPSRWDEVVKRIVEATNSLSGNLVLQHPDAGNLTALYNVDPALAEAYAKTYHKDDPLRTPEWSIAPGEVRDCSYTQTDSFKASAYYDEFVRPQGWVNLVAIGLMRTPDLFALLALTRAPNAVFVQPKAAAPFGNPCAAFAARGRGPCPACPDESNSGLARRGGGGRRFRRFPLDWGLPGPLRQPQGRRSFAAPNRLAL